MLRNIVISLFACVLLVRCMSVESEQESWTAAIADANKIAKKYPSLEAGISKQLGVAHLAWEEALKVEDETKKILAMKAARTLITNATPIVTVKSYESNVNDLERKIDKIKTWFKDEEFTEETQQLLADARPVLVEAKNVPNDKDITDLHLALEEQNKVLTHNINLLSAHYDAVMDIRKVKKQQEKEAAKAAEQELKEASSTAEADVSSSTTTSSSSSTTVTTTSQVKKEEVAMVKCRKCGSKSAKTESKCKSCGAKI